MFSKSWYANCLLIYLSYREASEAKYYDAESDRTVLDISGQGDSLKQADKERLAEDLRLIYVALTRAVYGCFIGAAPIRNGRSSKGNTRKLRKYKKA